MRKVIANQSSWGKLRVTGADRTRFLQGMVTNDVAALAPGGWCRAALLSAKGRVLAVVDVLHEGDSYLVLTEAVTAAKVRQALERHAVVDDVAFVAVEAPLFRSWDTPAAVWTAPPLLAAATASPEAEVEVRRIEAGLPRYGADVTEEHFPFEANLDSAISQAKGCYVGQEVVARAHARGHANRRLAGLRLGGETAAPGSIIAAAGREDAGVVTSVATSPEFGRIALGYLHRSAWDPGTVVRVGDVEAQVSALPFS